MTRIDKLYPSIHQPVVKGKNGYFTLIHGKDTIKASIINILSTRVGERVHLPEFGSKLHELVFEPEDEFFQSLAEDYVFEALRTWEPRIEVISALVSFEEKERNVANLTVQYRIKQPVSRESFVVLVLNRDTGYITGRF